MTFDGLVTGNDARASEQVDAHPPSSILCVFDSIHHGESEQQHDRADVAFVRIRPVVVEQK